MRLEAILDTTNQLAIEFDTIDRATLQPAKETLNISYRPNAYTPRLEEESAKAQSSGKAGDVLKAMLIPLIADWDLVKDVPVLDAKSGQPTGKVRQEKVPITMEGFDDVPLSVLTKILNMVAEDNTPSKKSPPSFEGSFS